jgi:hypothetical protein
MALEKVVEVDQIEVKGEYSIQVRTATKVFDDGKQIGGVSYHRHVVHPDMNWSSEDAKVKKIADSLFDADCKEAFHIEQHGYPSGDLSDSWSKVQLQKYCERHRVDYEESDSKAKLVEKIEADKGE